MLTAHTQWKARNYRQKSSKIRFAESERQVGEMKPLWSSGSGGGGGSSSSSNCRSL